MQEPTQPRCDKCGSSIYKFTETGTHIVYRCLSSSKHLVYVEKQPTQMKRSTGWNKPPNNAA